MARQAHSSAAKVFTLVLAIAFGVLALAFTYSAVMKSTEQRSRAAETELTIKQWEFNGTTTEGWTLTNFSSTRVAGGLLRTVSGKPVPSASLQNANVGANFPEGAKYLKFRLALRQPGAEKKSPGPTIQQASNVSGTVEYTLSNRRTLTRPLAFQVVADGVTRDVSVTLPEISAATVGSLAISFTGLKPGSRLDVDWIRLIGTKPKPTPTPLKGCYYQKVECVKEPCDPILVCPTTKTTPLPSSPPPATRTPTRTTLSCDSLYRDELSYFKQCSDNGYPQVCFNKYTGEYQGCGTPDYDGCTQYNTNASQNILCASSPSSTPSSSFKPL